MTQRRASEGSRPTGSAGREPRTTGSAGLRPRTTGSPEPPARARTPRLLVLEFLNRDRFGQYRSGRFPFVAGFARARALPYRWLAVGFDRDTLPTSRFRMALPPDEQAAVLAAVAALAPTHVLTNEELDAPLAAALREALPPDAVVAVHDIDVDAAFEYTAQLEAWLGLRDPHEPLAPDAPFLVDDVAPHHACELVGPLAAAIRPLTVLLGGPHCLYARPVARNPRYEGVDLAGTAPVGCAFCGEPPERRYPYRTPPVPLALKQLRAALATLPPERAGGGFALWGAAAVMRLPQVIAAILAEDLPPLSLFVAFRVDELRRTASRLEPLLPRLAAAGHALDLYNIGVENFSPAENERLNKGIAAADVVAVHALVTRWERDWPDTFRFTRHGGFGFILYTPWTTTSDLAINLDHARRLAIPTKSFFLTARLQLMPDRPVTRLAVHDGLTADPSAAAGLGGFDSGCIVNAAGYELPWRFRHPEVAAFYAVVRRLWPVSDVPPDEPLRRRVRALVSALPDGLREPLTLAAHLLAAAEAEPRPTTPEALLDRVEAGLPALLAGPLPPPAPDAIPPDPAPDADARRARLERWTRALLHRLDAAPQRPLAPFRPRAVTAHADPPGWGALSVTLAAPGSGGGGEGEGGDESEREGELRLTVLPRERLPQARWGGPRFAVTHDTATPPDTPARERALATFARALERWMAAREP